MMPATVEPQTEGRANAPHRKPSRLRPGLWIAVAVVFVAQVGLLVWLGNPPAVKPSEPPAPPAIRLSASGAEELLALQDPTLFVLPHPDNFSGAAWLKVPEQEFTPTNWTEPALPLPLPPEQLGATFAAFMQTNLPARFQPELGPDLGTINEDSVPMESISFPSTLRVEGELARLRLLTPLHLPPQTNADLLTNTVVQLLVDAHGNPFSAVLLAGSGSQVADNMALTNFAKAVRFAPAEAAALGLVPPDKMTLGKLIFDWQTMPPAPTNAPASTP
jgi:hypothetical protein